MTADLGGKEHYKAFEEIVGNNSLLIRKYENECYGLDKHMTIQSRLKFNFSLWKAKESIYNIAKRAWLVDDLMPIEMIAIAKRESSKISSPYKNIFVTAEIVLHGSS